MFFWNSLAFSMIQWMLAIWSLVPLPFLKPAWISGSSRFAYYWSLAWTILSITLLACEMSAIESCSVVSNTLGENSPGKNTGMGSLSFIQGIFQIQELNQGLLHCRQILYQLSYQGSPNPVNLKINITADKNHNSFGRSIRNTINPDENTLNNIISTGFLIKYICVSIIIQN